MFKKDMRFLWSLNLVAVILMFLALVFCGCAGVIDTGQVQWQSDLWPGDRNGEVARRVQAPQTEVLAKWDWRDFGDGWTWEAKMYIHTEKQPAWQRAVAIFRNIEDVDETTLIAAMTVDGRDWSNRFVRTDMRLDFPQDVRPKRVRIARIPASEWFKHHYVAAGRGWSTYSETQYGRALDFSVSVRKGDPIVVALEITLGVGERHGDIVIAGEYPFRRAILIQ